MMSETFGIMPAARLRGYDVATTLCLQFEFDPDMPSGEWKTIGNVVLVHCPNCAQWALHQLAGHCELEGVG